MIHYSRHKATKQQQYKSVKCSEYKFLQQGTSGPVCWVIAIIQYFFYRQLSNNRITRIETEAFSNVVASGIDFRNNSLRELQSYSFRDVTVSETLDLSELQFAEIPANALYCVSAKNIYLNNGGVTLIQPEALTNVTVAEDV